MNVRLKIDASFSQIQIQTCVWAPLVYTAGPGTDTFCLQKNKHLSLPDRTPQQFLPLPPPMYKPRENLGEVSGQCTACKQKPPCPPQTQMFLIDPPVGLAECNRSKIALSLSLSLSPSLSFSLSPFLSLSFALSLCLFSLTHAHTTHTVCKCVTPCLYAYACPAESAVSPLKFLLQQPAVWDYCPPPPLSLSLSLCLSLFLSGPLSPSRPRSRPRQPLLAVSA